MFPQTIRTFLRGLSQNRSLALFNVLGLALGFSVCILISLFIFDELGYDSHHTNLERIYRITTRFVSEGSVDHIAVAPTPITDVLTQSYPEVEACVRFDHRAFGVVVRHDGNVFREDEVYGADSSVFRIFTYDFIYGDPSTALVGLNKVVLTRSQALKYFDETDVVGNTLDIDGQGHSVTAVIEDVPANSEIRFSMLVSMTEEGANDWFDFSHYTFVMFRRQSMLQPSFLESFERKLQPVLDKHVNAAMREENLNISATLHIQPLRGLHFDNTLSYDTPKGNKNYVYIFSLAATLILFCACINYVNFSIVQSMEKGREVGIRKVIGSSFYQLVARYLTQSFMLTFLALLVSLTFVYLLLPYFNDIVGRDFTMTDLIRSDMLITVSAILMITSILAGSYPAFYGSSLSIVQALKGQISSPGGKAIRKASITVQFAVSLGLIIATMVIYLQMQFVRNYDLGFRPDNIIAIATPEDSAHYQSISAFKEEVIAQPQIAKGASVVGDGGLPGDPNDEKRGSLALKNGDGEKEVRMVNMTHLDPDYFPVLGVRMKAGRAFENSVNDMENSIIVNEALAQAMRWENPLEHSIHWGNNERRVIGVVGNIHYKALYNPVQPQIFVPHQQRIVNVLIALQPDAVDHLSYLQNLWRKYFPDHPFVYRYIDSALRDQYRQEYAMAGVSAYFSVLTIVISVLGMCGLSWLSAYQRRKEIGVRKVIGASFIDIAKLFVTEYFVLLVVALVVVSPLTWILLDRWLMTFVERTSLRPSLFIVISAAFALLTLVTIVLTVRKVARVKSTELIRSGP